MKIVMNALFKQPGPIQIRRGDIVSDVRELARLTNLPISDAVAVAVRKELDHIKTSRNAEHEARLEGALAILARMDALPQLEPWPTEDDFYDEDGLPK